MAVLCRLRAMAEEVGPGHDQKLSPRQLCLSAGEAEVGYGLEQDCGAQNTAWGWACPHSALHTPRAAAWG